MRTDDIHFNKFDKKIKYRKDLPKNENFEICIISTNADVRAKVTVDLPIIVQLGLLFLKKYYFKVN